MKPSLQTTAVLQPVPLTPSKPRKKARVNLTEKKTDRIGLALRTLCSLAAFCCAAILVGLILYIVINGLPWLTADLFSWTYTTQNVSMMPAIINTVLMIIATLAIALPVGIGAAIYLEEYAKPGSKFVELVSITAQTLAGIPSIVFGLFGMLFFGYALHMGLSMLSGILTLAILVLPLILRTSQEALHAVPTSMREASFALGAGRVQTIFKVVLPQAATGIFSGVLLASGRILGESAALIYTSGTLAKAAFNLFDPGATLSVHLYKLLNEGLYTHQANATAVVLLAFCIAMNLAQKMLERKMTKGL